MKTKRYIPIFGIVTALLLPSCVKDELYNTPHPDKGKVAITADWTDRGEKINIPSEWTVAIGDYTGTETGKTHEPDFLFTPGSHRLAAYNTPDGITINGTTATVASVTGSGNHTGSFIDNAPGWLFTSVQDVNIEADTDYALTAVMHQQTRQLTLIVEPTGDAATRIETIEGSLSGAAGTLEFATGTYGAASNVELRFTQITEGDNAGKWAATVQLLGITGESQKLTATLTYTGANPSNTHLESDLTEALKKFNSDKTQPLTIDGSIAETPTETGFTAEITDWTEIAGGDISATI